MRLVFLVFVFIFGSLIFACSIPEPDQLTVDEGPLKYSIQTDYPGVQKSDLFVFVGERVEVVEIIPPEGEVWFDAAFDAKYRIIETVFGEFQGSIIEFRVFDHYGYPPFAMYPHSMLFVSKHEGKLYHEKCQYHTVYKTVDGLWAACGDPYVGMEYHRKPFTPKPLIFAEPITFDLAKYSNEQKQMLFNEPYFEIIEGKAVCKMGAFADELFQINRDGVLKARGVGQ